VHPSPCHEAAGQVILGCGKRSEQRKIQLAVCLRKQNPAKAGLGVSLTDFRVSIIDFRVNITGFRSAVLFCFLLHFMCHKKTVLKFRCKVRGDFSPAYHVG
jgi:hypothetical protein